MSDRQTTAFILAALVALVLWLNNTTSPTPSASGGVRTRLMDLVDILLGRNLGGSPGSSAFVGNVHVPGGASSLPPIIKTEPVIINGRTFNTDGSMTPAEISEVSRQLESLTRQNRAK